MATRRDHVRLIAHMASDVQIYRVTHSNEIAAWTVAADVFDDDIAPDLLARYLRSADTALFVAVCDRRQIVGQLQAFLHRHPDARASMYIDNLGVTPELRRAGIASRLLAAARDLARGEGCESIWLATEPDNEAARGFYAHHALSERTAVVYEGVLDA
jgi:ribosomal protein S18 acetylase RimI-like enzyme